MNRKEIAEIRRRLHADKNAVDRVRGCYVNEKREVVATFSRPMMSFPQEEAEKYLAIFRHTLSGVPGRNLIDVEFRPDQVMEGEAHGLLMGLNNTALAVDSGAEALCRRIIDALEIEGNYLILMMHDAFDVPFRRADEDGAGAVCDSVFHYMLVCVCPVKLTRPALGYSAEDNAFHALEPDWVVGAPELGFMFPAFDDRATNIYAALYYTRDASNLHDEFIDAVFNADAPMPASAQRAAFQAALEDSLSEDLSFGVVETLHDALRERLEEHARDKSADPLEISRREVVDLLASCGVPGERLSAFEQRYDEAFGEAVPLRARNVVEPRRFELRTPDVVVQVNPERSDLIETRVIDGARYILIRAEEGVEVNGVNIRICE